MDKLYYISQGETPENHLINIKNACNAGCKLIQLRLKNESINIYQITADEAKVICDAHNAQLIINDNIEITKLTKASGVHLGKNDTSIQEARTILGYDIIIGGTANTLVDCEDLIKAGVNYIGLGPFQFTKTKEKLSPILGTEGFKSIIAALKKNNLQIPIYAIGGIDSENIQALLDVDVSGIAVSGILTDQNDLKKEVDKLRVILKQQNLAQ